VLVPDSESQWSDAETVLLAAKSCPTKAIFVYDEEGKQIYPEE
jgi:ferredoxin